MSDRVAFMRKFGGDGLLSSNSSPTLLTVLASNFTRMPSTSARIKPRSPAVGASCSAFSPRSNLTRTMGRNTDEVQLVNSLFPKNRNKFQFNGHCIAYRIIKLSFLYFIFFKNHTVSLIKANNGNFYSIQHNHFYSENHIVSCIKANTDNFHSSITISIYKIILYHSSLEVNIGNFQSSITISI